MGLKEILEFLKEIDARPRRVRLGALHFCDVVSEMAVPLRFVPPEEIARWDTSVVVTHLLGYRLELKLDYSLEPASFEMDLLEVVR